MGYFVSQVSIGKLNTFSKIHLIISVNKSKALKFLVTALKENCQDFITISDKNDLTTSIKRFKFVFKFKNIKETQI